MAFAFGKGNIGQTDTVTLGTYAQTAPAASLIVGNGTSDSGRSNGLVVMRNGEVQIPGSLSVGGSPALTLGNSSTHLASAGFLTGGTLGSALLSTSPPVSSNAWKNAFVPRGAVAGGALLSIGDLSVANQQYAIAIGVGSQATMNSALALGENATAAGSYSVAIQQGYAQGVSSFAASWGYAGGDYSLALVNGQAYGTSSIAIGGFDDMIYDFNYSNGHGSVTLGGIYNVAGSKCSYAMGNQVTSSSAYCFAIGSQNLSRSNSLSPIGDSGWNEQSALFELGNGNPDATGIETSNAITTLKNGRTTLTNKAWKANGGNPLADPESTSDSGGDALVIEGHTRLKGKVIIEHAQGDISMGIYGGN